MTPGVAMVFVTITESGTHGRKNLHTFTGTRPIDGHRQWELAPQPHSHAENGIAQQNVPAHLADFGPIGKTGPQQFPPTYSVFHPDRRRNVLQYS